MSGYPLHKRVAWINNLENFNEEDKSRAIALLERREVAMSHPNFETACKKAEQKYSWAYDVLIGPTDWYVKERRILQIEMVLEEIEKYF
jgi:hypothetical protein